MSKYWINFPFPLKVFCEINNVIAQTKFAIFFSFLYLPTNNMTENIVHLSTIFCWETLGPGIHVDDTAAQYTD